MVVRPEFDNWFVVENRQRPGFHFFDDERVLDIAFDGVFSVRTSKQMLRGRHLVGADGAYSMVNKQFQRHASRKGSRWPSKSRCVAITPRATVPKHRVSTLA